MLKKERQMDKWDSPAVCCVQGEGRERGTWGSGWKQDQTSPLCPLHTSVARFWSWPAMLSMWRSLSTCSVYNWKGRFAVQTVDTSSQLEAVGHGGSLAWGGVGLHGTNLQRMFWKVHMWFFHCILLWVAHMLAIASPTVVIKGDCGNAKGKKKGWLVNWEQW